jgi:hypothetical protein
LPAGADDATLKVELNGQDVSTAFIKASDIVRAGNGIDDEVESAQGGQHLA